MFGIEKIKEEIEYLKDKLTKIESHIVNQISLLNPDIKFELKMMHEKLDNAFSALSELLERFNKFYKKEEGEMKKAKKSKKTID
jgi:translation initiation factor 2 alpha subunit (eIF-2alpha)